MKNEYEYLAHQSSLLRLLDALIHDIIPEEQLNEILEELKTYPSYITKDIMQANHEKCKELTLKLSNMCGDITSLRKTYNKAPKTVRFAFAAYYGVCRTMLNDIATNSSFWVPRDITLMLEWFFFNLREGNIRL